MKRTCRRRDLDFAEVRRQQARDDARIRAWEDRQSVEYPLLREWLGLDAAGVEDGERRSTSELEDLEEAYRDLIQGGFARDRAGRSYDRYEDNPSNDGPGLEFDELPYVHWGFRDEDRYDDLDTDACADMTLEEDLRYLEYFKFADEQVESYREWIATSSTSKGDRDDFGHGGAARPSSRKRRKKKGKKIRS